MKNFKKAGLWIALGCGLPAVVAIGQNWLVAHQLRSARVALAEDDLVKAEKSTDSISAFAGSWFLSKKRSAQIFGAQADLALSKGDLEAGMKFQEREYDILGLSFGGVVSPEGALQFWEDRPGAEEWGKGFNEYKTGPVPGPPLDDSDLLPDPVGPVPDGANAWVLMREIESFGEREIDLAGMISDWQSGEGDPDSMAGLLEEHKAELAVFHAASALPAWRPPDEMVQPNAVDGIRLLLVEFIVSVEKGEFEKAADAFEGACRLADLMKGQPSIMQLLVIDTMRIVITGVADESLNRFSFPRSVLIRMEAVLGETGIDPDFPEACVRHSYAEMKSLLESSMLKENPDDPVARHLLAVTVRKTRDYHRRLAETLSPEGIARDAVLAPPPDGTERIGVALLDWRLAFSEALYGSEPLTESEGREAARLMFEAVAETVAATGERHLGMLSGSIGEQWEEEEHLRRRLRDLAW